VRPRSAGYHADMLRDERTPDARRNQRIVLPMMLLGTIAALAGFVLDATALVVIGAVVVLLGGLAWRWV
jgi:hypothetical protein